MADKIILHALPRTVTGKKVRALRREGRLPIVVYGAGTEPVALEVDAKSFDGVAHQAGTTQLIELAVEGEAGPRAVLIRDVQQHITRLNPLHADLIQVDLTKTIVAAVPVVITKIPKLAESGSGVMSQPVIELSVEALPASLPPAIEIDASVLEDFDESIKVSDLDLGEGVTVLDDPETTIVALSHLRAAVVEETDELEGEELEGEEGEVEDTGDVEA